MPFLDVSDTLLDPMLAQSFSVIRRQETVGANGRASEAPTTYDGVIGVITAASPNDLDRLPEGERMGRYLVVVTKFRLQGPVKDSGNHEFQPDLVVWQGDQFLVKEVDPYPLYGAGFISAIVGSIDVIDQQVQ